MCTGTGKSLPNDLSRFSLIPFLSIQHSWSLSSHFYQIKFWMHQPFLMYYLCLWLLCIFQSPVLISVVKGTTQLCGLIHSLPGLPPFRLPPSSPQACTHREVSRLVWQHAPILFHSVSAESVFQESPLWGEDSCPCCGRIVKQQNKWCQFIESNYSNKLKISTFKLYWILKFFSLGEKKKEETNFKSPF